MTTTRSGTWKRRPSRLPGRCSSQACTDGSKSGDVGDHGGRVGVRSSRQAVATTASSSLGLTVAFRPLEHRRGRGGFRGSRRPHTGRCPRFDFEDLGSVCGRDVHSVGSDEFQRRSMASGAGARIPGRWQAVSPARREDARPAPFPEPGVRRNGLRHAPAGTAIRLHAHRRPRGDVQAVHESAHLSEAGRRPPGRASRAVIQFAR